jgi:membrane-bound serine protease (ClpP class)
VPIHGTIEPGVGHFLARSLDEAADTGATLVILDINTPGGRLDTVLQMRDAILDSPVKTVAFVNREAFSAGALITIASDEIWMTSGAVFGAATPVDGGSGDTASEKTISAVRSTFRTTAEQRGRDPLIAEAMVDPAVVVDGLSPAGSLLTLSTDQAMQIGYANGVAENQSDLLQSLGLGDAVVTEMSVSPVEQLVRWITDPLFSSLLITLGLFLIIADALFAGFGIAAVAGVACMGLFFWGHQLAGLAGWEDLALIVVGLGLIALEIFVIPGFGVAGIGGIVALGAGLFLAMVGRGTDGFRLTDAVIQAGWVLAISLSFVVAALVALSLLGSRIAGDGLRPSRGIGRLALSATVDRDVNRDEAAPRRRSSWVVRSLGGDDVLERDQIQMPEPRPSDTVGSTSHRAR